MLYSTVRGSLTRRVSILTLCNWPSPQPKRTLSVRYTLDGREPTEDSPLFTAPVDVGSRAGEANVLSMISGTATASQHTDGWRAPLGEVRKATVVRARAFRPGALPGPVGTQTYWIGSAALRTDGLPTLSIVTDPGPLRLRSRVTCSAQCSTSTWPIILARRSRARARQLHPARPCWERTLTSSASHRTVLWPGANRWSWTSKGNRHARSGRNPFGSRRAARPARKRRSSRRSSRPGATGDGAPLVEFRHLRLRNAGNDWDVAMMRDDWCHRLVAGLGLDLMSSRAVSLFLDGGVLGRADVARGTGPTVSP